MNASKLFYSTSYSTKILGNSDFKISLHKFKCEILYTVFCGRGTIQQPSFDWANSSLPSANVLENQQNPAEYVMSLYSMVKFYKVLVKLYKRYELIICPARTEKINFHESFSKSTEKFSGNCKLICTFTW